MKTVLEWLKKSLSQAWEGLMTHLGTVICVFIVSGGYLIAINKLREFQQWVRTIPTDYVLTPLVFLLIVAAALWHINRKQSKQLSQIQQQPQTVNTEGGFVTHFGVWWKIYPEAAYIEDFPYCPCCDPKQKLVQTEWYPDEVFICPKTKTQIKLFSNVPRKRADILENVFNAYFSGNELPLEWMREFHRLKQLHPTEDDSQLARRMFDSKPLNRIPTREVESLLERFEKPQDMFFFIGQNYKSYYRKYLRRKIDKE